jgi:MFS family permease
MAARAGAAPHLFTGTFLGLCLVNFLASCNLTIFYGFHDHLAALGVPEEWRGPLLALEPFTAFVLRPFLGPLVTLRSGARLLALGLGLVTLALLSYPFALTVPVLACVRIVHGAGFVVLVSSVIGLLVQVMPRERSGQGFAIFSLTVLIPQAVMPAFVELALPLLGDQGQVYALAAPLMLPAFLALPLVARRLRELSRDLPPEEQQAARLGETLAGIRQPGVSALLASGLGLYTALSAAFFFLRPLGVAAGLANPGLFLTCSALTTIALRAGGSRFFDRVDKRLLLGLSLGFLVLVLALLPLAGSPGPLLVLAVGHGLAQGVAMPMLGALMVQVSPGRFRSLNSNLLLLTMDAGFFLGPLAGGEAARLGLGTVFWVGAVLALGALAVVVLAWRGLAVAGRPEKGGRVRPPERGGA